MTQRAADIEALEKILEDAGTFDELSDQAIEVVKRLIEEADAIGRIHDPVVKRAVVEGLKEQANDLGQVVNKIYGRKHRDALKRYRQFMRENKLLEDEEDDD